MTAAEARELASAAIKRIEADKGFRRRLADLLREMSDLMPSDAGAQWSIGFLTGRAHIRSPEAGDLISRLAGEAPK